MEYLLTASLVLNVWFIVRRARFMARVISVAKFRHVVRVHVGGEARVLVDRGMQDIAAHCLYNQTPHYAVVVKAENGDLYESVLTTEPEAIPPRFQPEHLQQ